MPRAPSGATTASPPQDIACNTATVQIYVVRPSDPGRGADFVPIQGQECPAKTAVLGPSQPISA